MELPNFSISSKKSEELCALAEGWCGGRVWLMRCWARELVMECIRNG
ncbi:hypothetical protein GJA_2647 [Janthinobacterium agaricidamnosum NBRC 102515 = DSM 9628]|uniref:Uncharacterized protein n=1 Tax=Janthinobacterium agaricidamnosum NBRC 102515 = DSM 9628 TaxID=1349767 RepID=W0V7E8_9BURK|nr:hypothetical protein GJA_2647 [Janthinobacterium agaricidamnosum NBRC 102515 = DSM 9628]